MEGFAKEKVLFKTPLQGLEDKLHRGRHLEDKLQVSFLAVFFTLLVLMQAM